MYAMGLRLSEQELDMLFKEFDVDGSGTIDIKEFQQMVKRYLCSNEEQAFVLSEERAREMKQKYPSRHFHLRRNSWMTSSQGFDTTTQSKRQLI